MAKPFKFRHVNEIAGAFVGMILILLVVGLVFAARAQKWFTKVTHITVEMPQGASGVSDGAEVHMMGTTVGVVHDVKPDDAGNMTADIQVDTQFAKFIHTDAKAIIRVPLALKDPFIEIVNSAGPGSPLKTDQHLIASPESDATDTLNRTVDDVRTQTLPAVLSLLQEYTRLAADFRDPHSPLQESLARLDRISAKMEQNDNVMGRLFNDKALADSITASIQRLDASTNDLHALLVNLNETSAEFPKIAKSASEQMDQLPALVNQTHEMMGQVTKALEDLQKSTAQLPGLIGSLRQSIDQLPDVMAHTQQALLEVQKLARAMQELPFVRDNVEQGPKNATLRPSDAGGTP